MDTVLVGKAYVDGQIRDVEIGISDGKIVKVGGSVTGGKRLEFGENKLILPGFMDPHVHLRDPGMTQKEDFSTGTQSALFAGVTCVLDMPNTKPAVVDVNTLMDKKKAVKDRAYTDYGLFAAVTPDCPVKDLAPLIPGFKLFMGSTTGQILLNDDEAIANVMADIKLTGKRMSVHAEDDSMILKDPEHDCVDHLKNRPMEAEHNAIKRLSPFKGMKVNVCHNTNAESIRLASELGFTTEITLHHMFFDTEDNRSSEYKVNPPVRDKATRDALYDSFLKGNVTMFGTDHAPHTVEEKSKDFDLAPSGIPGVETSMPIVMNMVRDGTIPLSLAVRMGAEAPAEAFGVKKGKIAEGFNADFAVFDMDNVTSIDVTKLHSKAGHTPYAGWKAVFPDTVMIRGNIQIKDGVLCGSKIGDDVCG